MPNETQQRGEVLLAFMIFFLLWLHPWYMEVPRLGVISELQLPAYATATATPDLSRVCDLHHSSWKRWVLNPLSEARDQTHVFTEIKSGS